MKAWQWLLVGLGAWWVWKYLSAPAPVSRPSNSTLYPKPTAPGTLSVTLTAGQGWNGVTIQ